MNSRVCNCTVNVFLFLLASNANFAIAQEPISVLLAIGEGGAVSPFDVVQSMSLANQILDNTFDELPSGTYRFESAALNQLGLPLVVDSTCPSGLNGRDMVACAILDLADERDQYNADVVVLFIGDISGDCGSVRPEMVSATTISALNSVFAYAAVDNECILTDSRNRQGFAHEVGHLLSLEHHDGDEDPGGPTFAQIPLPPEDIPFNHAEEYDRPGNVWDLTIMGGIADCGIAGCAGVSEGTWHPFFSEDGGKTFPVSGGPVGDANYSDAKRVVGDFSWDIVAAYKPIPMASLPFCRIEPITCQNTMVSFTSSGVGSAAIGQRRIGENGLWEDIGTVLGGLCVPVPTNVQNATRNFFRMISAAGQELCRIEVVLYDECDDNPVELW